MPIHTLPPPGRSLIERIAYALLAVAVIVLSFFFLAAAVVAGAILAAVVLIRLWWFKRQLRKAADSEYLTTEYTVVEREERDRSSGY